MESRRISIDHMGGNPHPERRMTIIEAIPTIQKKLKVAAYCRVSTAREEQLTSIEAQRTHFEDLVRAKDDWELVGIYYEEGVTGTKKEVRPELKRMLSDCRRGKIDLIITKSISRFARNASDCLEMVRELTGMGVNIYFEKENIHTGMMESEFILTVLASLAAEESRSISGNERWAIQKRFASGTYRFSSAPYGYRLVDGNFVVNPEEAGTVRRIFHSVLSGKGTMMIAKELNADGVPTGGKRKDGSPSLWTASHIQNMLNNVAYIGDVLMQKTFRDDNYHKYNNYGEQAQYYYDNHHEAIIDRETFELARASNRQRGKEKGNIPPADRRARSSPLQNRYCLTGKVFCGNCGSVMKRQVTTLKSGKRYRWVCKRHLNDPLYCDQKNVLEEDIQNLFMTMINKLYYTQGLIINHYLEGIRLLEKKKHLEQEASLRKRLEENMEKRHRLMLQLQKECIEPISHKKMMITLENEAALIRDELIRLQGTEHLIEQAEALKKFVAAWGEEGERLPNGFIREFPSTAFEAHVEKVVVYARIHYAFHLTCGLVLTESLREQEDC